MRQFLSSDNNGQYIYLILYGNNKNLEYQATLDSLNKEMNLAQTDLYSLEPVDNKFRPLRINYQIYKTKKEAKQLNVPNWQEHEEFKILPNSYQCPPKCQLTSELKDKIWSNLKEINFRLISKQTGCFPIMANEEIMENEILSV